MSLPADAVTLDAEMARRVEDHARAVGTTPDRVVRAAIEDYLAHHERAPGDDAGATALDVLERAGLIGCLPGAPDSPTDLSTNPAHMEGFGGE